MDRNSTKGFTLIELLVVIAIIAILAALLFPVYAKVKQKGKQASCLSNLGQLAKAALMYTDDNDRIFPLHQSAYKNMPVDSVWGTGVCYHDLILPYLRNQAVLLCPSSPDTTWCYGKSAGPNRTDKKTGITSYGTFVHTDGWLTMEWIKEPSKWEYLFDASIDYLDSKNQLKPSTGAADTANRLALRHFEGVNISYADGHAAFLKYRSKDQFTAW